MTRLADHPLSPSLLCAFLLLLTSFAGCLGDAPNEVTPAQAEQGPDFVAGNAPSLTTENRTFALDPITPLPDRLSTEPSIVIQEDGDIAVSGLATDSDPTVGYRGGYVWVSHDRAESFTLERDQANPHPAEPPAGCYSCDTSLVTRDGQFVLGTYYRDVNPRFDVTISQSNEDGSEWENLHPAAAQERPIDRPWLATGDNGTLLLLYRHTSGSMDRVENHRSNIYSSGARARWAPGPSPPCSSPPTKATSSAPPASPSPRSSTAEP